MDIKGFKNLLFTKAKNEGFSEYEIYYSEKKSFSVNIYKKQIEKYQNSETSGFGFRGIYNGKMGYYYSETIDESIIPEVIATAKINADLTQWLKFNYSTRFTRNDVWRPTSFNRSFYDQ